MTDSNQFHKYFEKTVKKQVKSKIEYKYKINKLNKNIKKLTSDNYKTNLELDIIKTKYVQLRSKLNNFKTNIDNKEKKNVLRFKIIEKENEFSVITHIVFLVCTFIFVKLTCYANDLTESTSQSIALNVFSMQIMFLTLYFKMFNPYKEVKKN
uniref:Uncharacterized protein n=1 Tax=viral metagenome TaxID=1070528 RepID=A0A6C0BQG0_9ZZZZ